MSFIAHDHPQCDILMNQQSWTTACSLRMSLVRTDDCCALTVPSVRRLFGEVTLLPTGLDLPINRMLKGHADKPDSIHMAVAILGAHRRATVPSAVHSLGGGQQQRDPSWDPARQWLRTVAMGCGPHAQLVSSGGAAVHASAERRRVLLV